MPEARTRPTGGRAPPRFADIEAAQRVVDRHLPRTPLIPAGSLFPDRRPDVLLKLDALSPLGSFKPRGVLLRLSRLTPADRRRGVITASTGNHGLAVAWAAGRFGMDATVVVPKSAPPFKADRIRWHGADVIVEGDDWNQSLDVARRRAAETGQVLLEDGEDPWIMAGAGTMVLETIRERPDVDCVVLPVGGGNLIAGGAIAAHGVNRSIRIVGVQAERAQGVYRSWKRGRRVSAPCDTFAGGIATTGAAELAFGVIGQYVDEMLLVTEAEMMAGIGEMVRHHAIVVEGAAAAPVAALARDADRFAGQTVALMVTGRNVDAETVRAALTANGPEAR